MVIKHNTEALNANRMLDITSKEVVKSSEKLSSGYRINRAADDAAGLSISEKLRKQIKGLTRGSKNCSEGMSLINVADGAMEEVTEMLQRMNVLSVKAANGTLSETDRGYISEEVEQIKDEIDRVGITTKFNDVYVLQGTSKYEDTEPEDTIDVIQSFLVRRNVISDFNSLVYEDDPYIQRKYFPANTLGNITTKFSASSGKYNYSVDFSSIKSNSDWKAVDGMGFSFTCAAGCAQAFTFLFDYNSDTITDETPSAVINSGGATNSKVFSIGTKNFTSGSDFITAILAAVKAAGGAQTTNASTANGTYDTVKVGHANYIYTTNGSDLWVEGAGASAKAKIGKVNAFDDEYEDRVVTKTQDLLPLDEYSENDIQIQFGADSGNLLYMQLPRISALALKLSKIDVSTEEEATKSIDRISERIRYVSTQRSRLGAYYNGLSHLKSNDDNTAENTTAAESQLRDTDMAEEIMKNTNENVLLQAGQAMLS